MKKFLKLFTIIVISTFIFTSNVKATPANTAFKDDVFYECIIKHLNDNSIDGVSNRTTGYKVTDNELSQLTSLDCNKENVTPKIKDVTGLSKMPNLEILYIWNNNISSIDVSKNTKLTKLYIGTNKISNIDISKNTELTEFVADNK